MNNLEKLLNSIDIRNYTTIPNPILIGKTHEYYIYARTEKSLIPKHTIYFSKNIITPETPIKTTKISLPQNIHQQHLRQIAKMVVEEPNLKKMNELRKRIEDFNTYSPIIFLAESPITPELKQLIMELNKEELNKLMDYCLTMGYKIDSSLKEFIKPFAIRFSQFEKDLTDYQKFMPNAIICTSTKAGKSSAFERLGRRFDRMSISNLMGSYYGEHGMIRGSADENILPLALDDIQEEKKKQIIAQALNLVELGKGKVGYGKGITAEMCSPVVILRNPNPSGDTIEEKMFDSFSDTIEKIGSTPEALGSRFLIFFRITDCALKTDNSLSTFDTHKIKIIHDTIMRMLGNDKIKDIFKKLENWLSTDLDEEYIKIINDLTLESMNRYYKDFWASSKESKRHLRGWALLKTIFDNIYDILHNNIDIDKIKKIANQNLDMIQNMNIKSMRLMLSATSGTRKELFIKQINRIQTKIKKVSAYLILKQYKITNKNKIIIEDLRELYNSLPEQIKTPIGKFYNLKIRLTKSQNLKEFLSSIEIKLKEENEILEIDEEFYGWIKDDDIEITNAFEIVTPKFIPEQKIRAKLLEITKTKGTILAKEDLDKILTPEEIQNAWEKAYIIKQMNNIYEIVIKE